MSDTSWYRIARNGESTGYGPYSSLSSARNVASNVFGGSWLGVNSVDRDSSAYDWETKVRHPVTYSYGIQKLTPVLRPILNGSALAMSLEWVDLD